MHDDCAPCQAGLPAETHVVLAAMYDEIRKLAERAGVLTS